MMEVTEQRWGSKGKGLSRKTWLSLSTRQQRQVTEKVERRGHEDSETKGNLKEVSPWKVRGASDGVRDL